MELCIVEQQPDAPAGLLGEWAAGRGARVHTLRAPEVGEWPDPRSFTAIVPLGSDRSVHASDDPWIATQIEFLHVAAGADVPVLGLCFGGQALAAALGAPVRPAPSVEIGWCELEVRRPGPVVRGPWFEWHLDAFDLPLGAEELARTASGPQAFRVGRSIGLQFHPEVTPEIVDEWVATGAEALAAHGVDGIALRETTRAEAPAARRRAFALFDAVASAWT